MIISSNEYLTLEQMEGNAQYIMDKLLIAGWTKNSICGMLGNMQTESTINPGLWESMQEGNMDGGFGLVQWTPASKYTTWATDNGYEWGNIDGQINRLLYELENNLQWITTSTHPMSFKEFTQSNDSPFNLAMVFIANYERPLEPNQPMRGEQAEYWYRKLTGSSPIPSKKKKGMPLYFYLKRRF